MNRLTKQFYLGLAVGLIPTTAALFSAAKFSTTNVFAVLFFLVCMTGFLPPRLAKRILSGSNLSRASFEFGVLCGVPSSVVAIIVLAIIAYTKELIF